MNLLANLPSELLSLCLSHVDEKDLFACILVNKTFYDYALPLLWQNLTIDHWTTRTKIVTALTTSSCFPGAHVRALIFECETDGDGILQLVEHMPQLEHLRLENVNRVLDTDFQHVPRHCPQLTTLHISYARYITEVSLVAFAQHCRHLETVEFLLCKEQDITALRTLRNCPLKSIAITENVLFHEHLKDDQVAFQETAAVIAGFQQLVSLRIEGTLHDYTSFTMQTWPHLTDVYLSVCSNLDDAMAIRFIQAHPRLRSLRLGGTKHMSDHTLDAIPVYLTKITHLDFWNCPQLTITGLCRLVKRCTTLVDGIGCGGCNIYENDDGFPADLDEKYYEIGIGDDGFELIWLSTGASDYHAADKE